MGRPERTKPKSALRVTLDDHTLGDNVLQWLHSKHESVRRAFAFKCKPVPGVKDPWSEWRRWEKRRSVKKLTVSLSLIDCNTMPIHSNGGMRLCIKVS